jgi:hypothetical protein
MQDPKKAAFLMKWIYSCMVPDPLEQVSCNCCPKSAQHSKFHYIKKVFKGQDAKKISREEAQEYKIVTSEKLVKEAIYPLSTFEGVTGYGIDHSLHMHKHPPMVRRMMDILPVSGLPS